MISSSELKIEIISIILHFTELSISDLYQKVDKKHVNSDNSIYNDLLSANPEASPFIETLFTCYLA